MSFGTIFTTLTFILIFAGMTLVVVNVQQNMAQSVQEIKKQTETNRANRQEITITGESYVSTGLYPWTTTYADEFEEGSFDNATTVGDTVQMNASNPAIYTSPVYDTGSPSNYTTISWSSIEPLGSTLFFQVRSGATQGALQAAAFVGPDGTSATYYVSTGISINDSHDGDQYIQYRAYFTQTAQTPVLEDATIRVRRLVGHTTINIENTGQAKLHFEETDAYINGVRIQREDSDRVLTIQETTDARLWNPGEELNVTIFGDYASSFTVRIANQYAQDETTVTP